jgi:ABC-2 type transport system permease protein
VLLVEGVVGAAASGVADWLPGSVLTALAQGGTAELAYGSAAAAAAAAVGYALVGVAVALVAVTRRDVTD